MLTVGSGNAWGATVTWSINGVNTSAAGGSNVNTTLKTSSISPNTETGVWTAVAANSYAGSSSGAQLGSNSYKFAGTITLSGSTIPSTATITKISLTCSSSAGSGSAYSITAKVGSTSFGSTQTVYGASATYNWTGSVVGNTVTLTTSNSNNKNLIITSLSITYSVPEPHTVTFNTGIGNPSVASRTGTTITLPSTLDLTPTCSSDGWELYGWANAAYGSSSTTTAPTSTLIGLQGGSYSPSTDITLYAVYVRSEISANPVPQTLTFSYSSHVGWTLNNCTDKSSYWLLEKYKSAYVESPTIRDLSTITSISVNAGYFGGSDYGKFKVYGGGTMYGTEQSPSTNKDNGGPYTLSPSPNPLSGSGKIKIECTGTSSSGNGTRLGGVTINFTDYATTYYYWSAPTCCTPLGSINGSFLLPLFFSFLVIYITSKIVRCFYVCTALWVEILSNIASECVAAAMNTLGYLALRQPVLQRLAHVRLMAINGT